MNADATTPTTESRQSEEPVEWTGYTRWWARYNQWKARLYESGQQ